MAKIPGEEENQSWHRTFAGQANNRAWELSERVDLTVPQKAEMRLAAYASAYHWSKVGALTQVAHAELLLARVHALLGEDDLAMQFARSGFDMITKAESAKWELAFAHAILSNAAAVSGDAALHEKHYATAKELGEALDTEDQTLFLATFELLPVPQKVDAAS